MRLVKQVSRARLEHTVEAAVRRVFGDTTNRCRGGWTVGRGDVQGLLDLQFARAGVAPSVTLNCGLYLPGIVSSFRGAEPAAAASFAECCASIRIGMLSPRALDIWWSLPSDASDQLTLDVERNLSETLEAFARPFFERYSTPQRLAEMLLDTEAPKHLDPSHRAIRSAYASHVLARCGDLEGASAALTLAREYARRSPFEALIEQQAARLPRSPDGTIVPKK
jgi:hypothetical protein